MRTYLREWGLAGAVAAIVLIGLLIEGVAGEVAATERRPPSGDRFVERGVFCPPSLPNTKTFLTASTVGKESVPVGIEPTRPEPIELDPRRLFVQELPDSGPADVTGFGSPVFAGVVLRTEKPQEGEAASRCSPRAASTWHFAAGASTLGADERLLIYNPFPDEAVVRVAFLTSGAEIRKASLDDVAVPARSAAFVRVNRYVQLQRVLAATVEAERGRVVAWKVLFDRPEKAPRGTQMALGVSRSAPTWYFPEGQIGPGADTRIVIANPNPDVEATVTVSVVTGEEIVQPPDLVEMPIPALSARLIRLESTLARRQRELGGVSVVVQSTNGTGIIAERTVRYSDPVNGSTAEIGSPVAGERWFVPPGTLDPSTDTVVVMNPGEGEVTLDLEILRAGRAPLAPDDLQGRTLASGDRLKIGVVEWTRGQTAAVLVDSSGPVVVERFSYSSIRDDAGSVMGVPLL